jgi:small-conductance mechanosensitive channel
MIRTPECYLIAFYAASRPLILPAWMDRGFRAVVIISVTYRVARMLQRVAAFATREWLLGSTAKDSGYYHTQSAVSYLTNALIWSLAVIFALDNMGFSVSSIIAGLGIGGIAVALAAQAVLGDLFAAIAIYLDRPFVAGDFIIFDDMMGTVDRIGFKTTRIRALSGELLVVPNSALASAKVHNYRDMAERRVVMTFGVAYGTPAEQAAALGAQIKQVVLEAGGDKVRFDRAHLNALNNYSLDYEIVFYVLSGDYNLYMDIRQRVNLGLLRLCESRGIGIPFPTQTIQLSKEAA